ncbi:IS4 family transposase [Legionella israelensis]|nr:IS4 family transposase [Legionella israelensis]QDP73418.1 IS4 family transposase [Legionella israelensis]QDP73493.1 IS4 family transposase [Legionella israelensis]
MFMTDESLWAEEQFQFCNLGDKRRTDRLIELAKSLCKNIGKSLSYSCEGDRAELEGGYRLIRNKKIQASSIAEGLFKSTKLKSKDREVLLAIEDSTSISYKHSVREELGYIGGGGSKGAYAKGFYAHSVLLVDPKENETLGLIGQLRWIRGHADYGKHHKRKERPYHEKESYKWEESSRLVRRRMGTLMRRVISVCDRESDVYEYLNFKVKSEQRFVIRAVQNRRLAEGEYKHLFSALKEAKKLGEYQVTILQKKDRRSRMAQVELYSCKVTLSPPVHHDNPLLEPIDIHVVYAKEKEETAASEEGLSWLLFTTEPVDSFDDAIQVIYYYQMRWKIEEFHKAWKSGAGVERQRMQSAENIGKVAVILATIAVRLLQLKENAEKNKDKHSYSTKINPILSYEEMTILWLSMQPKNKVPKPLPEVWPDAEWIYKSIAKLGGWTDSKRLGKASWKTLWDGWFKLQERLEGYLMVKNFAEI